MIPISISTPSVDPNGSVYLTLNESRTNLGDYARRVTRTATMDGGAVVVDGGFSHLDRTISMDLSDQSQDTVDKIRAIFRYYATVLLMLPDGAFRASPERIVSIGGTVTATFLISGTGVLTT